MRNVTDVLAQASEGFVDVPGGRIWYQAAGEGEPLVLLHGGPGATSDYLEALMAIADTGYRVVRYDQLGSGRSDRPQNTALWTVDRFVAELEVVRGVLGFETMHLLGQSWGAFLALEYALAWPERLQTLTLYSGAASTQQCFEGMNILRAQLPPETVAKMSQFEAAGVYDDPDYLAAVQILLNRHLCRRQPWPEALTRSMQNMSEAVYRTMWGPNEFTLTGNLASFDRTDRLGEIEIPTLIVCGRYDEVVPACSETLHAGIRNSRLEIFEHASHLSHLEEPGQFFSLLLEFLADHPIAE